MFIYYLLVEYEIWSVQGVSDLAFIRGRLSFEPLRHWFKLFQVYISVTKP